MPVSCKLQGCSGPISTPVWRSACSSDSRGHVTRLLHRGDGLLARSARSSRERSSASRACGRPAASLDSPTRSATPDSGSASGRALEALTAPRLEAAGRASCGAGSKRGGDRRVGRPGQRDRAGRCPARLAGDSSDTAPCRRVGRPGRGLARYQGGRLDSEGGRRGYFQAAQLVCGTNSREVKRSGYGGIRETHECIEASSRVHRGIGRVHRGSLEGDASTREGLTHFNRSNSIGPVSALRGAGIRGGEGCLSSEPPSAMSRPH